MFSWLKKSRGPRDNEGGKQLPYRVTSDPLEGYRIWKVAQTVDGIALKSLHHEFVWGLENRAECRTYVRSVLPVVNHEAPGVSCSCGLYAMLPSHPLTEWDDAVRGKVYATGSIAMLGRVIRCARGYKAERAVLNSPVVLDVVCRVGGCNQDVVRVVLTGELFQGLCGSHPSADGEVTVDAGLWMGEAIRQLTARYDGVEFISWME